jgi:hypothetical protein
VLPCGDSRLNLKSRFPLETTLSRHDWASFHNTLSNRIELAYELWAISFLAVCTAFQKNKPKYPK